MGEVMHKCIGPLLSFDGSYKGTAFLISPNIIVTAAQCVYNHQLKSHSNDTKFYPGLAGKLKDNKCFTIVGCFIPKEY